MSPFSFFLFYFVVVALAIITATFWFWKRYVRRGGEVSRSLGMVLFSVILPKLSPKDAETASAVNIMREKIAVMEQLYRNLRDIHDSKWHEFLYGPPVFALELTIPEVGQEVNFYISVPRRFGPAVLGLIQGLYSDAEIERAKDYNIFNPYGKSAGFSVAGARNSYLPTHTYQTLEADPLKLFIEAFSKIAEKGEGAALQIVARPANKSWSKRLEKITELLKQGKNLGAAVTEAGKGGFQKEAGSFAKILAGPKKDEKIKESPAESQNETLMQLMERKSSKPLFEAAIRVIASAGTGERAEELARSIAMPFQTFAVENVNGFKATEMRDLALQDFSYRFSFRLLSEKNKVILSSEELASFFHFPNIPIESPKVRVLKAREAPAPIEMPKFGLYLGKNIFHGEEHSVFMSDDDRRRHLYIVGQTGTGKSVFLKELARQDILNGKGVCYIDPHGDDAEEILGYIPEHRADDLIYFNPGDTARPMGLNMLEYDSRYPEQKTFIINELMSIFNKLYNMEVAGGPMFEQYFRNSALLVMEHPESGNTLIEISRVMSDREFRDLKLSYCRNPLITQFWQNAVKTTGEAALANFVPYITNKFDVFLSNEIMRPIVAQEKSAFNFRDVMDQRKILIINLSKGRLGELNSALLGLIMVGKILMAAFSRADIADQNERKDFYLYIDEFQNVTTKSIATILSEARKYRLDLVIAHQFIGQLEEDIKKAVFGNVGSIVSFRVGVDDTELLEKQFAPVATADDLLNLANRHAYARLLINGATARPFSFMTADKSVGNKSIIAALKEYSSLKYGVLREKVEEEILGRYQPRESSPKKSL